MSTAESRPVRVARRSALREFAPWGRVARIALLAAGTGIVAMVLGAITLGITPETLGMRWLSNSADDNNLHYMVASVAGDSPFFLPNDRMGFPNAQVLFFAPQYDPWTAVLLTLLGSFIKDGVLLLNLYHLLGFFFVGFASYLFFALLKVRVPVAIVFALVLTLAPFHLQRIGFGHAFVANYWAVPLVGVLILMVAGAASNPFEGWVAAAASRRMRIARRVIPIVVITLLVSLSLSYYFVFGAILMGGILLGSVLRVMAGGARWRDLLWPGVTVVSLAGFVLVQLGILSLDFGDRYLRYFSMRSWLESEFHGGRISSLLMPWSGSGFTPLAEYTRSYLERTPVAPTAEPPGTPIVAAIGMVLLVVFVLYRVVYVPRVERTTILTGFVTDPKAGALSAAFLWGLLFYTVSGLGMVFAALISAELRAWTRMSIMLIMLSLGFLALLVDRLGARRVVLVPLLALVVLVGGVDQLAGARNTIDLQPSADTEYREFFAEMEQTLEPDCGVVQLPLKEFPESGPRFAAGDYNHAIPYVLAPESSLRWSYAAMKGTRSGDFWGDVSTPREFAAAVEESEACAVLVDTLAFSPEEQEDWHTWVDTVAVSDAPDLVSTDEDARYALFVVDGR